MMKSYKSHPDKNLEVHIDGVVKKTQRRTLLPSAELSAIFHDLGKLNPNFQKKLEPDYQSNGISYSSHAYLSALAWIYFNNSNPDLCNELLENRLERIAQIAAIIAHHHGNLPNMKDGIFKEREVTLLSSFLKTTDIPVSTYLRNLYPNFAQHYDFSMQESNEKIFDLLDSVRFFEEDVEDDFDFLNFFLETQFSFASLIAADKEDAGNHELNSQKVTEFCKGYENNLTAYLEKFSKGTISELNKLRTEMREEAQKKAQEVLKSESRIFPLTAPTGAGKTMILLSVAKEIIKAKGPLKIIYNLPFLSITEQVFEECKKIFGEDEITRIDSKAENIRFQNLQQQADSDPNIQKELLAEQFASDTFEHPFIITTFVRFFETLVSNKNSTLLKLPNFSNCIFLIDEIQALPPRLYGFFVAYLDAFCRKFNSYAVISTATMPNFELPENDEQKVKEFFKEYQNPSDSSELLPLSFFQKEPFNRYVVERAKEKLDVKQLVTMLLEEEKSSLVILNTIVDTKTLYDELCTIEGKCVLLLNTLFTPNDRLKKITLAKNLLKEKKPVILISTQLIEAGVDISFPVVYRDMCTIPSLVQSAGRCNRSNEYPQKGRVILFELLKDGKERWKLIYRGNDCGFAEFAERNIKGKKFQEPDLLDIQKLFFKKLQSDFKFGYHESDSFKNKEIYFVERMREAAFEEIGKFQLIDKDLGNENSYYIPKDENNTAFDTLEELWESFKIIPSKDYSQRRMKQMELDNQLKKMSGQIVRVRLKKNDIEPAHNREVCGIKELQLKDYDFQTGICLDASNQII